MTLLCLQMNKLSKVALLKSLFWLSFVLMIILSVLQRGIQRTNTLMKLILIRCLRASKEIVMVAIDPLLQPQAPAVPAASPVAPTATP